MRFGTGQELLSVFQNKVQLKDLIEIYISANIGISKFPIHGADMEELLKMPKLHWLQRNGSGRIHIKFMTRI